MVRKLSPPALPGALCTFALPPLSRPKLARTAGLLMAAVLGTGCSTTASDMLTFDFVDGERVTVDTDCSATPCEGDGVEVEVTFDPALGVDDEAWFAFEQYRVDYEFQGTGEEAPYFADELALELAPDETATFTFDAAGSTQRAWVYGWTTEDSEVATATLTLAGYDQDDAVVEVSTSFTVVFEDVTAGGSADDASDTGA